MLKKMLALWLFFKIKLLPGRNGYFINTLLMRAFTDIILLENNLKKLLKLKI